MPTPEQEILELLRKEFRGIFEGLAINTGAVDALFKKVTDAYRAEERVYHTLDHIEHLLSFLKSQQSEIKDRRAVQLAAWFHDAIYDTKANDNEEQSAQLARSELKQLGLSEEIISHVERLVRATAKHRVIESDDDSAVFLDGDLSILGADDKEYDEYAAKIRQEYSWVPDEQYREGRKRILENFVARPRIYYTGSAHANLGARARNNLQREIERLK